MTATTPDADAAAPPERDELDQRLLNELQAAFPLVDRPFEEIGRRLGLDGAAVLARVARLKTAKVIRQISAIFDSRQLGYQSSLVAMKFAPEDLEAGAAIINLHPGVSHNYKRSHAYNLWFTLAVPPGKDLAAEVDLLAAKALPLQTWMLPTIKLFKIGVNLDMTGEAPATATETETESIGLRAGARGGERAPLTADEQAAVAVLQRDLAVVATPFAPLAAELGWTTARLLAMAADLEQRGYMRRFAAVLHHRTAGFRANAMAVWVVPPERIAAVGAQMAAFKAVSHCYQRPTYADWPYSVFTMIHGHHASDCEAVVAAISQATGITEHALLYSTKEYKKTRVRYFVDDDLFDAGSLPVRG